jgi:hypothetical protein
LRLMTRSYLVGPCKASSANRPVIDTVLKQAGITDCKRTSRKPPRMSVFDPKRTSPECRITGESLEISALVSECLVASEQHGPEICAMFGDLRNFIAFRWS